MNIEPTRTQCKIFNGGQHCWVVTTVDDKGNATTIYCPTCEMTLVYDEKTADFVEVQ